MRWSPSSRPMAMIPRPSGRLEGGQVGLLHDAAARDHQQVLILVELADRDHAGDPLPLAELEQVDDRPTGGGAPGGRDVINLQPEDLALVGEEQDVVVGQGDEHVFEEVPFLGVGGRDPPAAAALGAVGGGGEPLDVAVVGDGHDHVLLADQRFLVVAAEFLVGEHAASGVGILALEFFQVGADQGEDLALVGQDRLVAGRWPRGGRGTPRRACRPPGR